MPFPVVEQLKADPAARLCQEVERLAEWIQREHAELAVPSDFRDLVPTSLSEGPTLHLDDLSEIPRLDPGKDTRFYQDRARLRAGDGDLVASCGDPIAGHEEYCRDMLGFGTPEWLRPRPLRHRMRIAEACWEDPAVRNRLAHKHRQGELQYIHPHMGTFAVWELGWLLRDETNCPLSVIAPPPPLTKWVNNKVAFAECVTRLLGAEFIPRTESAWSLAWLAPRVKELAEEAEALGLKLPDGAGGGGNIVLPAEQLRGKSLRELMPILKAAASAIDWRGDRELLVDVWESHVLSSPSVQLWIPPDRDGPPMIEGVFEQVIEGDEGVFVGAVPATLPRAITQQIGDYSWLLARLFQRLGYVGRCSLDLIVTGTDFDDCRLEFIECNGRWGGTSVPMMMMNRMFGDWTRQPFAIRVFQQVPGLADVELPDLLTAFQGDLFDVRSRTGSVIFYNPGRLRYQAGISVIGLGANAEAATKTLRQQVTAQLQSLANPTPGV
jgi:hypothetical protein